MLGGYKFTTQRDGNMAEYFFVNDADYNLAPTPKSLSDEQALYTTDMMTTGLAGAEMPTSLLAGLSPFLPRARLVCAQR